MNINKQEPQQKEELDEIFDYYIQKQQKQQPSEISSKNQLVETKNQSKNKSTAQITGPQKKQIDTINIVKKERKSNMMFGGIALENFKGDLESYQYEQMEKMSSQQNEKIDNQEFDQENFNSEQQLKEDSQSYQYFYQKAPQFNRNSFHVLNPNCSRILAKAQMRSEQDGNKLDLASQKKVYEKLQDLPLEPGAKKKRKKRKPVTRVTQRKLKQCMRLFRDYERDKMNQVSSYKKVTLAKIALMLDMNHATVVRLYQDFKRDHTMMNRFMKLENGKKLKQPDYIVDMRVQALKKMLQQNPFLTQGQMMYKLNQIEQLTKGGRQVTRKNIWEMLKTMKFTKKKVIRIPKFRNTPQNIQRRYQYCNFYKKIADQKKKAYFLDESAFSLGVGRQEAWSAIGQPVLHKVKFPEGKSIALVAIMAIDGIVAWQIKNNNFQRQHYLKFMEKFFKMLTRDNQRSKADTQYLIMDNCKIHDWEQSQMIADRYQVNLQIKRLPPYSPQLNPIQNWFHQVKAKVRKSIYNTEQELRREINRVISQYQVYDFSNYFKSTYQHTLRGINRQEF